MTDAPTDALPDADPAPDPVADAPAEPGSVEAAPARQRRRPRLDRTQLVLSFVIAVGLALVGWGLAVSITGDDRANLPDTVEAVDPVPEAVQVLNQTRVYVDLAAGYTGVLVIDGIELPTVDIEDLAEQFTAEPGQQIELPATTIFEAGNATLTFTPSDEALVTGFDSGQHRAQVIYWKIDEGRQRSRSYSWTFTVV